MPLGRPPKNPRSPFAARIHALREQAKLSQGEVAAHLAITQQSYAMWERRDVALSVAQLEQLAALFQVPITAFFNPVLTAAEKPRGPVGRAKKTFEAVSQLPRAKQTRVLDVVETLVRVHSREAQKKTSAAR